MNTQPRLEPVSLRDYSQNRRQFPPEELIKYAGQYVAFSLDGTRVVASGATEEELEKQLLGAGIDPSQVVGSYIPPSGVAILQ
jgi:Family of unknown function (DUF5678)